MMMMLTNTKMGIVIFANECCPDRKKNFVIVSMKTKNDNLFWKLFSTKREKNDNDDDDEKKFSHAHYSSKTKTNSHVHIIFFCFCKEHVQWRKRRFMVLNDKFGVYIGVFVCVCVCTLYIEKNPSGKKVQTLYSNSKAGDGKVSVKCVAYIDFFPHFFRGRIDNLYPKTKQKSSSSVNMIIQG